MLALAVSDDRILRGVSATLSYQFVDSDGTPAAPSGTATVGITRADGTVLVTAGTAVGGTLTDPRTFALVATSTLLLDLLTVTWTDAGDGSTHVQYVEIVGGYFFSDAEARAAEPPLRDVNAYPLGELVAARREVEDEAEWICGRAFVPRFRRATLDGSGRSALPLPDGELRTVRSVSVGGVAYGGPELAALELAGSAIRQADSHWPAGVGNVVVEYEYGWNRPPAELVKASLVRLRSRLNMPRSAVPDRAERFVLGADRMFELAMPGEFKTGLPDVDAIYQRYSARRLQVRP